ncbi:helix-turn-helix domain-containing protein [Acetivibrio mesophilus]|uniref:XRE family transcriptional regulator n=1 Tax=Acetivibrio mesophilus TaxID=2487273 RepID=A0A4Q0I499_9FIRM|nr:helix-turn-helix transcriptional regulator [Acetivibrio mesophilus]RXE57732.1 XRE family transcriptional regulator [Acetivibrio mesophilus]
MNIYKSLHCRYDGERISVERARRGISMRQLAEQAELDIKTISRIERNQVRARPQSVGRIATVLGMDIIDFIIKEVPNDETDNH